MSDFSPQKTINDKHIALQNLVESWIKDYIVSFNLCPFAKKVLDQKRIRFRVCDMETDEELLEELAIELHSLESSNNADTSIMIFNRALTEFDDYLDFLELANQLLMDLGFEGIFQLASFHPHYQFADTLANAAENFTNRSPLPLLHILKEADVEKAVKSHPNVAEIPKRNIKLMTEKGTQQLNVLLQSFQAK